MLLSVRKLVMIGSSGGSDLYGFVEFFLPASCLLLLNRLKDPIFMVSLSYLSENLHAIHCPILPDQVLYPTILSQFTVRSYLGSLLLIFIDQYIYPCGVILMCTMLLCGSYKCTYKG